MSVGEKITALLWKKSRNLLNIYGDTYDSNTNKVDEQKTKLGKE